MWPALWPLNLIEARQVYAAWVCKAWLLGQQSQSREQLHEMQAGLGKVQQDMSYHHAKQPLHISETSRYRCAANLLIMHAQKVTGTEQRRHLTFEDSQLNWAIQQTLAFGACHATEHEASVQQSHKQLRDFFVSQTQGPQTH